MKPFASRRFPGAFSLTEIIVTIAILGVLAAVALPIYSNVRESSRRTIAEDHVELLNRALSNFTQACWKLPTAADNSASTDEYAVLRSLQWTFPRSAADPIGKPGSPFFEARYNPVASSNSTHYRVRWNGRTFELLSPGQSGTGLRIGSESATPWTFPGGYAPVGP